MKKFKKFKKGWKKFLSDNSELRYGQSCIVYLKEFDYKTYSDIFDTEYDCFYRDTITHSTLEYLKEKWENDIS